MPRHGPLPRHHSTMGIGEAIFLCQIAMFLPRHINNDAPDSKKDSPLVKFDTRGIKKDTSHSKFDTLAYQR